MSVAVSPRVGVQTLTRGAMCAALIAVCSWISIPTTVPFTLQTFAVFLTCELMGGAGIWPVALYILLGAVGVPVFAGFSGGMGPLLGPTGGYIWGFLALALTVTGWKKLLGGRLPVVGMALGLAACYLFGTLWFVRVYAASSGPVSFAQALSWCVLPYVIPDAVKIALARMIGARVKAAIRKQ